MAGTIEQALRGRDHATDWRQDEAGDWRAENDGGRLVGTLREVGGAWEARVFRHETGPSPAPDPVEAHGPTVFEDPALALDYVEGNLGW